MISKHENNKSFSIGCIEITKNYAKKLCFSTIFNRFKVKGQQLSKYVTGLISHKLHFSRSINHASDWMNEPHILVELLLNPFNVKTLYRVLAILGRHEIAIMTLFQRQLHSKYDFRNTDSNYDWSSIILYGDKSGLGAKGYSRDGCPDKKQLTFGIAEYREPINVPYTLTVSAGNVLDKQHFPKTFKRTLKALISGSLLILDRGANTEDNRDLVRSYKHHFLCSSSLSKKVDKRINTFQREKARVVEEDEKTHEKVYCLKYEEDNIHKYLYFSEKLYGDVMKRKKNSIKKTIATNIAIEDKINSNRKYKKKSYELKRFIATETLSVQKRLKDLTQMELKDRLFSEAVTGREGFFLLISSKNLTPNEALEKYRSRDSIEKLIDSLKNIIKVKPVRVWTDDEIKGALLIGFFAQVIISLMKHENKELKRLHPKNIVESIRNLTLTIEHKDNFVQNRILSNLDAINQLILSSNGAVT